MVGSERLSVSGNSWFSAKTIQVVHFFQNDIGKALINLWGCLIGSFEISETLNDIYFLKCRQTYGEKVLSQKGNSPDHQLKS